MNLSAAQSINMFGAPERAFLPAIIQPERQLTESEERRIAGFLQSWFALRASDCILGGHHEDAKLPDNFEYPHWLKNN